MTKPRPDQPGRCPSIDPHDTLQCTRSIHSDDHCRNGGISWHRGSPRVLSDRERAELAEADLRHIAECLGEDPDDVPDGHRLVDHLALRVGYLRGRDAGFDDVEAERDTLAATLAHVEALAERWEAEDGEAATARDLTALNTINRLGSDLRAALAGPTALDAMGADQ